MKFSEFSVKNSLFVNLLSALVIVVGLFSMLGLNKEAFPPVSFDVVMITTSFRGASAQKVERLVTIPIEREVKEVDNINEIISSSYDGLSFITLRINSDVKNMQKVVNNVQKAVDRVSGLPDDVSEKPIVTEITSGQIPVIKISLSGQMTEFALRQEVDQLRDKLEEIEGVSSVEREGWRDEQFVVEPDLKKMTDYHVSFRQLVQVLGYQNVDIPGGKLEMAGKEAIVKVRSEIKAKEDIEDTVVRANDLGNMLKVGDMAEVKHAFADEVLVNRAYGFRAITLTVIKRKSGDILDIVDQVNSIINDFRATGHPELKIATFYDISYYVKRRLKVLTSNGAIGFVFVVVVLFTFLPPVCALLTALGIPIAMFTTFWVMSIWGITINLITMFGLITVLGMVVDDGIIISENVYRYIEKGYSPAEAAVRGTDEVMRPVLATVLTTIVAFSPLMMMSGLLGKFVRYIPIMVIIALAASLVEAFIILPSHLADFAKPFKKDKAKRKQASWLLSLLGKYKALLIKALNNRYKVVSGVSALLVASIIIAKFFLPFQLFSSKGVEQFSIRLEAVADSTLKKTTELVRPVEKMVEGISPKYLDTYETVIGDFSEDRGYDPNAKRGSNLAQVNVYLTPSGKRDKTAHQIMEDYRSYLDKLTKELMPKGVKKIYMSEFKDGPPVGKAIDVRIKGDNYEVIREIINEVKGYVSGIDGVVDVVDSNDLGAKEVNIIVDEESAQKAFLTNSDIAFAVRAAFSGVVATTIKQDKAEKEIQVLVRLAQADRNNEEIFSKIKASNRFDNLIPLEKVAKISYSRGMRTIKHVDGKRFLALTADVDNKKMTSVKANGLIKKRFKDISTRYPGYAIKFSGENEETQESMSSLLKAFLIAAGLIFLILATQFHSLSQPFVVMLTIPFGLIGFIVAFILHAEPLSFLGMMGFVGLTGVVVNDSIVLVDFINKKRSELPIKEAVIEAGILRLRPVMLTTITTVCGLSTVVYGIGGFDPFLRPMALAISWGLMFATGLTLVVIPCVYVILDDLKAKIGWKSSFSRAYRE
ncbi:MAG: efflux RND transporter permease subunit [Candidatus Omnitrophica bacterium]|nr:efflux RND transporter permease subunit [Candidatus Omnitrophota bacterium]